MANNAWHEHCILRDDVRQGTLELAEFAADLYAVRTGDAPNVYRVPTLFFDRTYPTYNLKTLARDVLRRLAGQDGNPVITLQVAYGGGKTHSLITLLHLAEHGTELQTHSTVQEFMAFSDLGTLPRTRVAILPFDEFDVKKGLSVVSPDGKRKRVQTPWGALAYQLAGDKGLAIVAEHEADYINPQEQPLRDLLKIPQAEGMSTLILLDEALMYTRAAVNDDPNRFGILQDFFQALTQAVEKVSNAAIVASLITSDIVGEDPTGVRVLKMLEGVFHRLDKPVEPVSRGDVSELLRRRLFEDVPPEQARRAVVDSLIAARQKLPLRESDKDQEAYSELLKSYPFHPDLIEVFYQKWTQLDGFQGTRGMFRTFALILRAAAGKDPAAFVGPSALLTTGPELSDVVQELVKACDEGTRWIPILTGELERSRNVQKGLPMLKVREIEAAVLATFLHSQPAGQKAELADLYLLLTHADIDPMSVEKGLSEWREASWFLKENENSWALGTTPNLTNMHVRAMNRINEDQITENLKERIRKAALGKNSDKVNVHTLPHSAADLPENPELRFVIAEPERTAVPGENVSESLAAFFNRTYRNSVIVLAPENSRLIGLRQRIRKILGWESIESGDDINLLNPQQKMLLPQRKQADQAGIAESIIAAYSVLLAVDEEGDIKASLLPPGPNSPFERVKAALIDEDRLLATSLDPELLTPESYLDIWGEDETAKPVQGLYGMFASLPRLPRLLNRQVFIDTLRRGVTEGQIVLRTVRPDGSQQTYWREASLTDEDIWKKELEIVPIAYAELHNLSPELLRPGQLSELWQDDNLPITVGAIREFFKGDDVPKLASDEILFKTIQSATQAGLLMARRDNKAYLKEHIPDAEMTDDMELLKPLEPISGSELSHNNLPDAWENETSSVGKIIHALALLKGSPIPWSLTVDAINDGLDKKRFEFIEGSPPWPCPPAEADKIGLKVSQAPVTIAPNDLIGNDAESAWESGQPTLALIKETLEAKRGISISDDVFRYAVEQAIKTGIIASDAESLTNGFYKTRVRKPAWMRHAESELTELEVQELPETVIDLAEIAPELDFKFRITISAEGGPPSSEVLEKINEALRKVTDKLKFG
ncbi:ATP-binding protein [Candidatus Poribacteria bacterium]|nr:ATP-binding protein [Candidatus Poribacteria bacterium]MYK18721.1 ATP-binding protein [Candidatus Poribacteria bacterium]